MSREDYTAGLMGEALETSTDRAAALRSFVERIDPAEARQMRRMLDQALRGGGLVIAALALLGYAALLLTAGPAVLA